MTLVQTWAVVVQMVASLATSSPAVPLDKQEVMCMAKAVYFEARGEDITGQMAVAAVVKHRMEHPRYPKTACGVVLQRAQFSPDIKTRTPRDREAWALAVEVAAFTLAGYLTDPVPGALYFHSDEQPGWAKKETIVNVAQIGGHQFYGEVEEA